ncbi:YidB family protein [Pseudaminobacter sp. NGMCC 1.201702]|uniref:YidB family protein n=1 Tax=Pseudaminobacter sp. NGMCC 1.201702 TaxID=3391825 RepID=UPI0039EEA151
MLAAIGILAYKNRDKLGELLSEYRSKSSDPNNPQAGGNILDQVLSGASGGLAELLEKFRNAGKGEAVDSWVKQGPNKPIDPTDVASAIDAETMDALVRQTGMSREEILARLATSLPEAVDEMTPEGRLPEDTAGADERDTLLDPVPPRKT